VILALLLLVAFAAAGFLAFLDRLRPALLLTTIALAVWVLIGLAGATITTN
jgi:hypothetical protein